MLFSLLLVLDLVNIVIKTDCNIKHYFRKKQITLTFSLSAARFPMTSDCPRRIGAAIAVVRNMFTTTL
jgi:hypothetical protein